MKILYGTMSPKTRYYPVKLEASKKGLTNPPGNVPVIYFLWVVGR